MAPAKNFFRRCSFHWNHLTFPLAVKYLCKLVLRMEGYNRREYSIHIQFKRHLNVHEIDFCTFMNTHSSRIMQRE